MTSTNLFQRKLVKISHLFAVSPCAATICGEKLYVKVKNFKQKKGSLPSPFPNQRMN